MTPSTATSALELGSAGTQKAGRPIRRSAFQWARENLFSSPVNAGVTLIYGALLLYLGWRAFEWAVLNATISGASHQDCSDDGACWTYLKLHFRLLVYGRYPIDEQWRVDVVFGLGVAAILLLILGGERRRGRALFALFGAFPSLGFLLLHGGFLGLRTVPTELWSGLLLNLVLAFAGISVALLLSVFLALGRRSAAPLVRYASIGFIEFWRGVPLITVLFTALVLLPVFLPDGTKVSIFGRALAALIIFYAASMAEVIRGGLQALPKGQYEAASSLGLGYWRTAFLVILPQALRIVIPGIVNTMIQLFKDTSLVATIGLLDLLGIAKQSLANAEWMGLSTEAYAFVALVFFLCCSSLSRYGHRLEQKLKVQTL